MAKPSAVLAFFKLPVASEGFFPAIPLIRGGLDWFMASTNSSYSFEV